MSERPYRVVQVASRAMRQWQFERDIKKSFGQSEIGLGELVGLNGLNHWNFPNPVCKGLDDGQEQETTTLEQLSVDWPLAVLGILELLRSRPRSRSRGR